MVHVRDSGNLDQGGDSRDGKSSEFKEFWKDVEVPNAWVFQTGVVISV